MIPLCHPLHQYLSHRDDIRQAIGRVLEHGHYILGEEVRQFEKEFSDYLGLKAGVGVGNGTDALQLALLACGIKTGDEVITVSHTAVATVSAIVAIGATPVLVDVDPDFYTMDPMELVRSLSPKTKAVIAVHLYGQPADLHSILSICREKGLYLIEDCAQAHGAKLQGKRVGSFGDLSTFSFYPTKNLGAIGDGGFVTGMRQDLVEKVRLLRQYGWERRYISDHHGINSRLDELQAAILRIKLKTLDADNSKRRNLSALYSEHLENNEGTLLPKTRPHSEHVFHLFVVQTDKRETLIKKLETNEIGTGIHYPVPVHLQPGYAKLCRPVGELPITKTLASRILSLPMFPELTESQALKVVSIISDSPMDTPSPLRSKNLASQPGLLT